MAPTPRVDILTVVSDDNQMSTRMEHPLEHLPLLFVDVLELVHDHVAESTDPLATFRGSEPRLSHIYEFINEIQGLQGLRRELLEKRPT